MLGASACPPRFHTTWRRSAVDPDLAKQPSITDGSGKAELRATWTVYPELVAEFWAAFLCAEAAIDNNAAYIAGWYRVLRADKRLEIEAARQGQKAAAYITGS